MKLISGTDTPSVYCTLADQSAVASHRTNVAGLVARYKADALIGEHVYVSASHMLTSETSAVSLEKVAPLVEAGVIAVGLRDDCSDLAGFAEFLIASHGYSRYSAHARAIKGRAARLAPLVHARFAWSPANQQGLFKESLRRALGDDASVLRRRMTAVRKRDIQALAECIADTLPQDISRREVHRLSLRHVPTRVAAVMREVNALYYGIGSFEKGLVADLSPAYFDYVRQGCNESLSSEELDTGHAIKELLNALVLPPDILTGLTPEAIVHIRKDHEKESRGFREKWWSMTAEQSEHSTAEVFDSLIREAVSRERKALALHGSIARGLTTRALFVTLATAPGSPLATDPKIAILAFLIGIVSGTSSYDHMRNKITGAHFHVLSSRLRKAAQQIR